MAKRKLGLSQAKKKQKLEEPVETETTELTVELPNVTDVNDGIGQVQGLWEKYKQEGNELIINGIIHECDRILRAGEPTNDLFYCYYGLALNELNKFDSDQLIISEASERIEDGLAKYPDSINLQFVRAKVGISKAIKEIEVEKTPDFKVIDEILKYYETGESHSQQQNNFDFFNSDTYEVLELFDHYLEVADESDEVDDKYNHWWRDHNLKFIDHVKEPKLHKKVSKNLGVSYLQEAEDPSNIYTTLMYDEEFTEETINGITKEQAQKSAIQLYETAIKYLKQNWDDEDPETWVGVAEAMIGLGNLYEDDEQEKCYKEAEDILVKANNVSNGKYREILDNLIE